MSIIKNISGERPYEIIPRELLQQCDKNRNNAKSKPLSLQAIGLLCNLQSYPESWEIHKTELYNRYEKNGRRQIQNAWNELVDARYIVQFKVYEDNKLEYYYYFSTSEITDEQIEELEEYHSSEKSERFDLKPKEATVQNEQYSNDAENPTVQSVQYNSYSTEVNSTKCTDNIIHNQYNTQQDITHEETTHNYKEKDVCSSNKVELTRYIEDELNIKMNKKYKETICTLSESFSGDMIMYAIDHTAVNATNAKVYLKTILENWIRDSISTLEDAKNYLGHNVKVANNSRELTPKWLKKNSPMEDRIKNNNEKVSEIEIQKFKDQLKKRWSSNQDIE